MSLLSGPDEALDFLRNITDESLMEEMIKGLRFSSMVPVRLKADNKIAIETTILNIAARYNLVSAIEILMNNGCDIDLIDSRGNNSIDYSCHALALDSMIFLLINQCRVNETKMLQDIFKTDLYFEKMLLLSVYSSKPLSTLFETNHKKEEIEFFKDFYETQQNFTCFTTMDAYIEFKTPKIEKDITVFEKYFNEIKGIIHHISKLEQPDARTAVQTIADIIQSINKLISNLNNIKLLFSSKNEEYIDLTSHCDEWIHKLMIGIEILQNPNKNISFVVDQCDYEPFIHCAIIFKDKNEEQKTLCKNIFLNTIEKINSIKTMVPALQSILSQKKEEFHEIGEEFTAFACLKLNNIYNFIINFVPEVEFNIEFRSFLDFLIDGSDNTIETFIDKKLLDDLESAISNLKITCMRCRWKFISSTTSFEEKNPFAKMKVIDDIIKKQEEVESSLASFNEFPSTCPYCNERVCDFCCPFCNTLLFCSKCQKLPLQCLNCKFTIKQAQEIHKISYFGYNGKGLIV